MSYKQLEMMEEISESFNREDSFALKEASNRALGMAVAGFDKTYAKIAIAAYVLSKITSKEHILKNPLWSDVKNTILAALEEAAQILRKNKAREFQEKLGEIEEDTREIDKKFGNYLKNTWDKAKIKIASSAYAQGLSLSQASELAQANKADLQNYIGFTKIHDEGKTSSSMKHRMKMLRELLA
ncbi:MAG: hypothetical protein HY392_00850 [Candidatus Diapherotrites archaeon]|nr:hypothetical protein [Candidatus Diapherotrites archaeon]